MGSIHTVFEAVVDNGTSGKKVRIGVADRGEYETVRTRLVKLWNDHKQVLISIAGEGCDPLLEYSLCADFFSEAAYAEFFLGKPRRKPARSYSFVIVDSEPPNPPQLPEAVNDGSIAAVPITQSAE